MDREKSRHVLEDFLEQKPAKLEEEARFLRDVEADCVLSDAAFLGWCATRSFSHVQRLIEVVIVLLLMLQAYPLY